MVVLIVIQTRLVQKQPLIVRFAFIVVSYTGELLGQESDRAGK